MASKIQLRRGLKSALPTLSAGEPAYTTDTRELFVGTGSGNVNMGGSHWYTGAAMSGTSSTTGAYSYSACPQMKVGDCYLNTTYGYVYQCTTAGSGTGAKWTYQGCIKGATGATGATGTVDYTEIMSVFADIGLIGNEKGTNAQAGTLYTVHATIGSSFYVSAAEDWYDSVQDVDNETFNATLYNRDGTKNQPIAAGESAIIKVVSSNKALVLMKA